MNEFDHDPETARLFADNFLAVGRETVHFLTSHPTPPTFDGAEDRNGRRNHDEIRFNGFPTSGHRLVWADLNIRR